MTTLLADASASALLDEDDVAALEGSDLADADADLSGDSGRSRPRGRRSSSHSCAELERRPPNESKMGRLLEELRDAFAGRHDTA